MDLWQRENRENREQGFVAQHLVAYSIEGEIARNNLLTANQLLSSNDDYLLGGCYTANEHVF